jgi:glycosyltransferase involved in cell wall biosynthesis
VVHLSTLHRALDVRIFYKECRTLAARGHQVHYLVPDPPPGPLDGVRFLPFHRPTLAFRPGRIGARLAAAFRQAAALAADVYHFHDPELIPVGLALRRRGARVIYDVHEDAPVEALTLHKDRPWHGRLKSWAFGLLESAACRCLDAFVCATPAIARKFPGRRTITVQNFPLLEEFHVAPSRPYGERPPHLVYAGGITAIRGAREMVRSLEVLPSGLGARLLLAGEFSPPALRQEVAQLPGWRHVIYLGQQPRAAAVQLLGQARAGLVLFHPERDHIEAMPNKLFELMAAGLPVVTSDFPLWRGIVAGAGCGLLVDPLDPAAVAEAVRWLLEHPAEAEAMGRRGAAAARSRYHWGSEGRKLLDLYDSLAGKAGKGV